jgi:hypothetical protein
MLSLAWQIEGDEKSQQRQNSHLKEKIAGIRILKRKLPEMPKKHHCQVQGLDKTQQVWPICPYKTGRAPHIHHQEHLKVLHDHDGRGVALNEDVQRACRVLELGHVGLGLLGRRNVLALARVSEEKAPRFIARESIQQLSFGDTLTVAHTKSKHGNLTRNIGGFETNEARECARDPI